MANSASATPNNALCNGLDVSSPEILLCQPAITGTIAINSVGTSADSGSSGPKNSFHVEKAIVVTVLTADMMYHLARTSAHTSAHVNSHSHVCASPLKFLSVNEMMSKTKNARFTCATTSASIRRTGSDEPTGEIAYRIRILMAVPGRIYGVQLPSK